MTKLSNLVNTECVTLIDYASSVLNKSIHTIREIFPFHEVCVMDNPGSNDGESILEIRFNNEEATLSCALDTEKRCKTSYLFPDDSGVLMNYINYLNEMYVYDFIKSRWTLPASYVSVKKTNFVTCFIFCSTE